MIWTKWTLFCIFSSRTWYTLIIFSVIVCCFAWETLTAAWPIVVISASSAFSQTSCLLATYTLIFKEKIVTVYKALQKICIFARSAFISAHGVKIWRTLLTFLFTNDFRAIWAYIIQSVENIARTIITCSSCPRTRTMHTSIITLKIEPSLLTRNTHFSITAISK